MSSLALFTRQKKTIFLAKFSQCLRNITKWALCERTVMFYMSYIPCEIFANIEKFFRTNLRQNLTLAEFFTWNLVHSSCETIRCFLTNILCESGRTSHVWRCIVCDWLHALQCTRPAKMITHMYVIVHNIGPSRSLYIFQCIFTMFIHFYSCFRY